MLQIKIIAVGKIKEKFFQEAVREYSKRLAGYIKLQIIEVDDEPCPDKLTETQIERIRQKEGERILKHIQDQDSVILLDIKGESLSSPEIADFFARKALQGQSRFAFIIGGSTGVSAEVKEKAHTAWSFSRLTFPHQLFRVLLLEQIYRACKINQGEAYHK